MEEEIIEEKSVWKVLKQDMLDNVGIELLLVNNNGEEKQFIAISKFEKKKNVIIPLDQAEEIGKKLIEMARHD